MPETLLTPEELALSTKLSWQVGLLRYKLEPRQREVYDALHRAIPEEPFVIICHRGFGKTFTGCDYLLEKARRERDGNQLIISSTLKKLRTIVKPAFDTLLLDCPDEYRPKYETQDSCYYFPATNMRTFLLAAQGGHIENARGIHNVTDVLIDEAGFFGDEEDSYPLDHVIQNILLPMFIRTKSQPRIVIMTTPPEIPNHPVKAYYERAVAAGCCEVRTIYQSDIPVEKRESMKRMLLKQPGGEVAWKREMECQWIVDAERLIIPEWKDEYTEVPEHDQYFPFYQKYGFLDTGVRDFTFNGLGYYDFKRAMAIVEDEVLLQGDQVRTDILAAQVKAKEKSLGYTKMHRRIADNNNLIIIQDLAGPLHGLSYVPTTKDELFAMVNEVRLWVSAGRLRVHPRCTYLIGCLANGLWDKAHKEFARSATYGHYDGLAALCYWLRHIDEHTNPVPATFATSTDTHHIPPGKTENENYKALREAIKLPKIRTTTSDWRTR